MQILVLCAVRIVPDLIFFTAQRSENMFYIFTSDNITFSKYGVPLISEMKCFFLPNGRNGDFFLRNGATQNIYYKPVCYC